MDIESTVRATIEAVIRQNGRAVEPFDLRDNLVATGLSSLDLASVIAVLERELGADPFLEFRSITEVRTVGDLCAAYRDYLSGRSDPAPDAELRAAHARAANRDRAR